MNRAEIEEKKIGDEVGRGCERTVTLGCQAWMSMTRR